MTNGFPIHGEAISADASGGVALTLYPNGSLTALVVGAKQRVVITDLIVNCATASVISVLAATAAAGRYVYRANMATTSQVTVHFITPYTCPIGITPLLLSGGAVACSVILQGSIVEV